MLVEIGVDRPQGFLVLVVIQKYTRIVDAGSHGPGGDRPKQSRAKTPVDNLTQFPVL